jgi:hypothetical protein
MICNNKNNFIVSNWIQFISLAYFIASNGNGAILNVRFLFYLTNHIQKK